MEPAIPKYLEHTAFGVEAKRKYPQLFVTNDAATRSVARMLPHRLVRTSASFGDRRPSAHETSRSGPTSISPPLGPVIAAGEETESYVATMPFPLGSNIHYYEIEVEAVDASDDAGEYEIEFGVGRHTVDRTHARDDQRGYSNGIVRQRSSGAAALAGTALAGTALTGMALTGMALTETACASERAGETDSCLENSDLFPYSSLVTSFAKAPLDGSQRFKLWSRTAGLYGLNLVQSSETRLVPERPVRVGILTDRFSNKIHVTKNGVIIKSMNLEVTQELEEIAVLIPIITIKCAQVKVVFGDGNLPNDGFLFDVQAYMQEGHTLGGETTIVPKPQDKDKGTMAQLLLEYFAFYGYEETVQAWTRAGSDALHPSRTDGSDPSDSYQMATRRQIRESISRGDIERVYGLLESAGVASLSRELRFKLDFQAFVQLVRSTADPDVVLERGRALYSDYNADTESSVRAKLEQASGMLFSNDRSDPAFASLYGAEALQELTTEALSAISVVGGREPLPRLSVLFDETYRVLCKRALQGHKLADALVGRLEVSPF